MNWAKDKDKHSCPVMLISVLTAGTDHGLVTFRQAEPIRVEITLANMKMRY